MEIEKKLAKLAAFEAAEDLKNRWLPFHALESDLSELFKIRREVETAAIHAEEAEDYCTSLGIDRPHHASDELWEAHAAIEGLIEKTEKEVNTLFEQLSEEEE